MILIPALMQTQNIKNIGNIYLYHTHKKKMYSFVKDFLETIYHQGDELLKPIKPSVNHYNLIDSIVNNFNEKPLKYNRVFGNGNIANNFLDDFVGIEFIWNLRNNLPGRMELFSHNSGSKKYSLNFLFTDKKIGDIVNIHIFDSVNRTQINSYNFRHIGNLNDFETYCAKSTHLIHEYSLNGGNQ